MGDNASRRTLHIRKQGSRSLYKLADTYTSHLVLYRERTLARRWHGREREGERIIVKGEGGGGEEGK